MTNGRTYWYAEDASYLKRALVVELGEEFGPAVPGVLQSLKGDAKHQNDGGRVLTGFVTVSRDAFVGDPALVRRIIEKAHEIGLLDDLEIQPDGRRFSCRLSGWHSDQEKVRAAQRQAQKRARDEVEQGVTDRDNGTESHGASQKVTHTGQDRTEDNSTVEPGLDDQGSNPEKIDEARARLQAEAHLFKCWQTLCHHEQAKFSKERRQCIRARRRSFTDEQLARAIYGASVAAYVDDRGKRHDDLTLVFRNDSKVEDFIDRADRYDGLKATTNGSSVDADLAAFQRMFGTGDGDAA